MRILLLWLLVLGILSLFVTFGVVYHKTKSKRLGQFSSQYCRQDADCAKGEKCVIDSSDEQQNVCAEAHMKRCELADFTKLTACDPNDPTSCDLCVNQPKYSCVRVNFGKPSIINPGRRYTTGLSQAALLDPNSSAPDLDRTMDVIVQVSDSANGFIDKIVISNPKQQFNKNDRFIVLSGNMEGSFQLTEQPSLFMWRKSGTTMNLPESPENKGWCLPQVDRSIRCNPYTSDSILMQTVDADGKAVNVWGCYCKTPTFMQHDDTPVSNCSTNVGCSGYDLYIPPKSSETRVSCTTNANCTAPNTKCCTDERCLKGTTDAFPASNSGICYTRWDRGETERNPRNGVCDCPTGTYFGNTKIGDYVVKTCGVDACQPGGTKSAVSNLCECKPGYVSCSVVPSSSAVLTDARCAQPLTANRCVLDPCAPGGTRNANGTCTCKPGYFPANDPSVIGGKTCQKKCTPGPCGNRGACLISASGDEYCGCWAGLPPYCI